MKATFDNSVSVLVRAYLNGTLQHLNSCACAVGNLVAAAGGYKYQKLGNGSYWWTDKFPDWRHPKERGQDAEKQFDLVGYSYQQIRKIELAFEGQNRIWYPERDEDENTFRGLLAVVDVLAEIHGVDLTTKQSAVLQFEEIHATK